MTNTSYFTSSDPNHGQILLKETTTIWFHIYFDTSSGMYLACQGCFWQRFWPFFWHRCWHSIWHIFVLAFYLTISSDVDVGAGIPFVILFWVMFWHTILHRFWYVVWHCLAFYLTCSADLFDSHSDMLSGSCSDIVSGYLAYMSTSLLQVWPCPLVVQCVSWVLCVYIYIYGTIWYHIYVWFPYNIKSSNPYMARGNNRYKLN